MRGERNALPLGADFGLLWCVLEGFRHPSGVHCSTFHLQGLQTSNSKLQTENFKDFKLQAENFKDFKLQTPNFKLKTSNSKLQTSGTPNSKLKTVAILLCEESECSEKDVQMFVGVNLISYLCGIETRERSGQFACLLHSHNQCITCLIWGSTIN